MIRAINIFITSESFYMSSLLIIIIIVSDKNILYILLRQFLSIQYSVLDYRPCGIVWYISRIYSFCKTETLCPLTNISLSLCSQPLAITVQLCTSMILAILESSYKFSYSNCPSVSGILVITNNRIFLFFLRLNIIPMYVCIQSRFFIHSFTDGHLVCFHTLVIVNNAAVNMKCRYTLKILISVPLDM